MLDSSFRIELAPRQALAYATLAFRGAKIRFEEARPVFAADADLPLHAVLQEMMRDPGLRVLVKAFPIEAKVMLPLFRHGAPNW